MTSRASRLALAVVVLLVCLVGYQPASAQNTVTINLTYNGGTCQQNGAAAAVNVTTSQSVSYMAANSVPFQVSFSSSSCPFATCTITGSTGGQTPSGTVGNTYYPSSVSINGQNCNNPGSMGIRINPGP
ncbi:MAG: hypothetical protein ABSD98_07590 [Candidatus Korobacteraceae bacterium]|jgi:hypothetical protein